MKYMWIHVGCTNIFHHDTWHVTCLSVVSRWCHPWREWENIHQPPPTVSCHSVCPRLRVTKNIQQSSDVNMEHATLHGWLLGSVKGWIIVNYRSAKLTNPLRNKAYICERMFVQGFNAYQWIEKNKAKCQLDAACICMRQPMRRLWFWWVSEWARPPVTDTG